MPLSPQAVRFLPPSDLIMRRSSEALSMRKAASLFLAAFDRPSMMPLPTA